MVDEDLYESLSAFAWNTNSRGYAVRFSGILLHRVVLGVDMNLEVDHQDGNRLDCRRSNLRVATARGNAANRGRSTGEFSSRFKGVTLRRNGKWYAHMGLSGRKLHLGTFENEEDAARAYDAAALAAWGEFARLNFPDGTVR